MQIRFVMFYLQNYCKMSDKSKLLEKKQYGDNVTVAKMLNTTPLNVAQLMRRPHAKRHEAAFDALAKVIEARDKLLTNK